MKRKSILIGLVIICFAFLGNINYALDIQSVEVTIPHDDVKINGTLINNQHNKYPMITYKNIFYLPLTEGYSRALGLITSWYGEREFIIEKDYNFDAPIQDSSVTNDLDAKYYATIFNSKIIVDEEEIFNNQEEYPILYFRDMVYLPITTRYAKEFVWKVSWDEEDGLSVCSYAPDVYDITVVDDWIYFRENYKMYKMRIDGSDKTMFADASIIFEMRVDGDWIYYINGSDGSKLYKIKVDGSKNTKLSDDSISEIVAIDNNNIYYIKNENYSYDDPNLVYKMTLDGKKEKVIQGLGLGFLSFPFVQDGWIYYENADDDYKLYKIKTNGKSKTKLIDAELTEVQIIDDWIYFIDISDYHLYKARLDGSDKIKVSDEKIYSYIIDEDWIYYSNIEDKDKLYRIKLDGSEKSKLNNDRSQILKIVDGWIYYRNYYDSSLNFLSLVRINISNGTREVLLPKGPTKYYYTDGKMIKSEDAGEWLLNNFKVSYLEINDDLPLSIEIIKDTPSKIFFVKHNSDYMNSYSDISLHEVGIDKKNGRYIFFSDKEDGYVIGLEANEKYIKWEELYKEGTEYFVDIYVYDLISNKRFFIKKVNSTINDGFYRIHTSLDDDKIVWLENHDSEEKSYIKLYDLTQNKEKTIAIADFIDRGGIFKIPIFFVDMDNGKIIFDEKIDDEYYYTIYDVEKDDIINRIKVPDSIVLHFSGQYDLENGVLGIYVLRHNKDEYYEEIGYIDINTNEYKEIHRLKNYERIFSVSDTIQMKNGYLTYNIEKNVSGYIYDHYYGYIVNIKNNKSKELKGSFEVKIYKDYIGNISFDKEKNANKINYEIMSIDEVFNNKNVE